MFEKGIRTVANLGTICPRHKGFGLAKTSVASGQRDPSITVSEWQWTFLLVRYLK